MDHTYVAPGVTVTLAVLFVEPAHAEAAAVIV
jgi:hypothetical protein